MTEQGTTEQGTTDPRTGLDKIFAPLRGIGVRRRTDDKWIGGVCSGFADRLGVDPVIIRVALVLLFLLQGFGLAVYLVAWALLPNDKGEIAAERALRDGDSGSIVLLVVAVFAVFGIGLWDDDSGWGLHFSASLVLAALIIWWLVVRFRDTPDADHQASSPQPGSPYSEDPSPATFGPSPATSVPSETAFRPVVPRKPRRRSGGPLMALLAIGLAMLTYGSLSWLGSRLAWTGDHRVIALAGSLAAIGLLLVVLGLAGWRAGFVAVLAVVLAITAWSSSVVPAGIHLGGRIGNANWAPTSVTADENNLGIGNGVLDLSGLPKEGLSEAKLRANVGLGELEVVVPEGLTVQVRGHVGLGEIILPDDVNGEGQGGTDISRSEVIGAGPTEVVVDAGVGVGQLTVVKE